jgi:hypothetical protein
MGIVDGDDPFIAARLVVALRRPAHRLASLVVGKRDLAAVEGGKKATESVGLTRVCARIGQLVGLKVFLDSGEPTEQLVAEDFRLGRRKVDWHDPGVGRRVLISHEELRLLVVRPSTVFAHRRGPLFVELSRTRNIVLVAN